MSRLNRLLGALRWQITDDDTAPREALITGAELQAIIVEAQADALDKAVVYADHLLSQLREQEQRHPEPSPELAQARQQGRRDVMQLAAPTIEAMAAHVRQMTTERDAWIAATQPFRAPTVN